MISRSGIGTLAAGGGIIATVVCLLVGFQLLLLGAEIGTWIQADPSGVDPAARAWQTLVRASGLLSLVAGGLVMFLVTAYRQGWRVGSDRDRADSPDIEDVEVRIFEVDGSERTVEVTPGEDTGGIGRPVAPGPDPAAAENASQDILDEIDRVIEGSKPPRAPSWRRFLSRFFGRK